ncbi:MAG: transcription initiation factor IIB family protein [Candidatus Thorarchaeota archaeon]
MTINSRVEGIFNFCSDCGAHNSIIYNVHTSEKTCSQCGLVVEEREIDISSAGARYYTKEERNKIAQNGPFMSNHTSSFSLSTTIPLGRNRDQNRVFKKNVHELHHNRNLRQAYIHLGRIYANLKLPINTKGEAEYLYLKALKNDLIKGHSIVGMVVACILYVGRKYSNNIRETEVADQIKGHIESTRDPQKHLRKCYSVLVKELNLKPPVISPLALIPRYVSELKIDQEVESLATEFFLTYSPHINFTGKDPKGIAAASVYLTCRIYNIRVLQNDVVRVAGTTDVTLRNRMKEFYEFIPI